jgi:hypothetical protein
MGKTPASSPILLAKGVTDTGRGRPGSAPSPSIRERPPFNPSYHHILPIRDLYFVGYLIERYRDHLRRQTPQRWSEDALWRRVVELVHALCARENMTFHAETDDYPNLLAWMNPNLFEGPAPQLRSDDPEFGRERKPWTLDSNRWKRLDDISKKINELADAPYSNTFPPTPGRYGAVEQRESSIHLTARSDITVTDLEALLGLFRPLLENPRVHEFNEADWILSAPPQFGVGKWFNRTMPLKAVRRTHYGGHYLENYRPKMTPARGSDSRPYLWRLRRDSNDQPSLEVYNPVLADTEVKDLKQLQRSEVIRLYDQGGGMRVTATKGWPLPAATFVLKVLADQPNSVGPGQIKIKSALPSVQIQLRRLQQPPPELPPQGGTVYVHFELEGLDPRGLPRDLSDAMPFLINEPPQFAIELWAIWTLKS